MNAQEIARAVREYVRSRQPIGGVGFALIQAAVKATT